MPQKKNKRKTALTTNNRPVNGNTPLSPLPNNGTPMDAKANGKPTKPAALEVPQAKSTNVPPKSPKQAPAVPAHQPALDYKEVQRNEVEVLQSIWMEDYIPVVKTGAWNVSMLSVCWIIVS